MSRALLIVVTALQVLYSDYWLGQINIFTAFKNPVVTSERMLRGYFGWMQHDTSSMELSTGFIWFLS